MPDFKITPEIRKKLGGFLPWEEGETAPFTPAEFEQNPLTLGDAQVKPVFHVAAFTRAGLKAYYKETPEGGSFAEDLIALFQSGEGLKGWDNYPIPFSKDNIAKLPGNLLVQIGKEVMAYTVGPTKEEKTVSG